MAASFGVYPLERSVGVVVQGRIIVGQSHHRGNAVLEQGVDQIVVMVDAFLIDRGARHAERKDPTPGDTKGIGLHAGGRHSCDVLLVQIVAQVSNTRPVEKLLCDGGTTPFIHACTLSLHCG